MNFLRRFFGFAGGSPPPRAAQTTRSEPGDIKPVPTVTPSEPEKPAVTTSELETPVAKADEPEKPSVQADPTEASTATDVPAITAPPPGDRPQMIDLGEGKPPMFDPSSAPLDGVTRPLPQEVTLEINGAGHALFSQATDLGRVRTNNEDAIYSFYATGRTADGIPDFGLFVVADGMGGHSEGELASALAARTVATHILQEVYLPLFNREERDNPIAEVMTSAIQRANEAVVHDLDDGGTTISAAVLIGDLAYIGHVGDSRVYLINRGRIERITRDHSWVQRLIELDQLTPDEANEHPQKNLLYRALGQSDTLEVDTLMRRMPPGARVVLCSDGLWNQVSDADILEAVTSASSLSEGCTRLISLANAQGGPDNISVVLVQLPG